MQIRRTQPSLSIALLVLAAWFATARNQVDAHEGPPFPILMDEPVSGHKVSVWADPDIGEARFFIIVESPDGGKPTVSPSVSMWTEPINGRLPRANYKPEPQPMRNHLQFLAQPIFDQRDHWTIGVELTNPDGLPQTITTEVESTPPGFGAWDLMIYLFPFVLFGGMWVIAMFRRRQVWQHHIQVTESSPAANLVDSTALPKEMERIK